MLIYKSILAFALVISLPSTHMHAQSDLNVDSKITEYLKRFSTDYIKGMKKGKPEIMLNYYADTVRLMPAFQRTVLGKNNTQSYYEAYLKRFEILDCNREIMEILDLGERVLEIGSFSTTVKMKAGDQDKRLSGNYMNIWGKDKNGRLALLTEAWNYDQYYEGFHEYLKFENVPAVTTAFQTHAPVNNAISFELEALGLLLGVTVADHDAARWSQFYTDDAILIPNYYPLRKGRNAIDDYIKMHVKELPVFEFLDIRNDEIDNMGDYVIEYAGHVANWRTGEYSGVNTGKNIRVWRREPDCSLKIFRQIGMYD